MKILQTKVEEDQKLIQTELNMKNYPSNKTNSIPKDVTGKDIIKDFQNNCEKFC